MEERPQNEFEDGLDVDFLLTGNAVHSVDSKGRIVVPAKFRDGLGSSAYAILSPDGCIRVYSVREFRKLLAKICKSDVRKTALRRHISASAEPVKIDSQGRMLVPEEMRLAVGITDKVKLMGMIEWVELWKEEKLKQVQEEFTGEQLADMMLEADIS